jgi:hypothetical protein
MAKSPHLHGMSDTTCGLMDPAALLARLYHEFNRLRADEGQQTMLYTAFDFFVTAYSLIDWITNSTPGMIKAERDKLGTLLRAP